MAWKQDGIRPKPRPRNRREKGGKGENEGPDKSQALARRRDGGAWPRGPGRAANQQPHLFIFCQLPQQDSSTHLRTPEGPSRQTGPSWIRPLVHHRAANIRGRVT